MKNIEKEIQKINDKITYEIRVNRALRAEIEYITRKDEKDLVLDLSNDYSRRCDFVQDLFQKYAEIQENIKSGIFCDVGELTAILKSLEIEEKYLLDRYYKSKAHCTISYFASEKLTQQHQTGQNLQKNSVYRLLLIFFTIGIVIFTILV